MRLMVNEKIDENGDPILENSDPFWQFLRYTYIKKFLYYEVAFSLAAAYLEILHMRSRCFATLADRVGPVVSVGSLGRRIGNSRPSSKPLHFHLQKKFED